MKLDDLIGPLIGIAALSAGGLIAHMIADASTQGEIKSDIKNIKEQIGSHETGIRGELHRQVGLMSRLRAVVYFIGRKLDIEIMKDLDE